MPSSESPGPSHASQTLDQRRPRSAQTQTVAVNIAEAPTQNGSRRFQLEVSECVETKTVTTTTRLTRKFPQVFVRDPTPLSNLDAKEYPLAMKPAPPELSDFSYTLGKLAHDEPDAGEPHANDTVPVKLVSRPSFADSVARASLADQIDFLHLSSLILALTRNLGGQGDIFTVRTQLAFCATHADATSSLQPPSVIITERSPKPPNSRYPINTQRLNSIILVLFTNNKDITTTTVSTNKLTVCLREIATVLTTTGSCEQLC